MEFREEMSAFVRSYAVCQYQKEFPTPCKSEDSHQQMIKNVNAVREVYKQHRYYRRKTAPPVDLASRVQITLLEYGMHADAQSTSKADSTESFEQQQTDEVWPNTLKCSNWCWLNVIIYICRFNTWKQILVSKLSRFRRGGILRVLNDYCNNCAQWKLP